MLGSVCSSLGDIEEFLISICISFDIVHHKGSWIQTVLWFALGHYWCSTQSTSCNFSSFSAMIILTWNCKQKSQNQSRRCEILLLSGQLLPFFLQSIIIGQENQSLWASNPPQWNLVIHTLCNCIPMMNPLVACPHFLSHLGVLVFILGIAAQGGICSSSHIRILTNLHALLSQEALVLSLQCLEDQFATKASLTKLLNSSFDAGTKTPGCFRYILG